MFQPKLQYLSLSHANAPTVPSISFWIEPKRSNDISLPRHNHGTLWPAACSPSARTYHDKPRPFCVWLTALISRQGGGKSRSRHANETSSGRAGAHVDQHHALLSWALIGSLAPDQSSCGASLPVERKHGNTMTSAEKNSPVYFKDMTIRRFSVCFFKHIWHNR